MSSPSQMANEGKSTVGDALFRPAPGDAGWAGLGTAMLMLPLAALHSSAAMLTHACATLLPSQLYFETGVET
jgi:hypothetical protein